jgi:peroxiredoxin-like protein
MASSYRYQMTARWTTARHGVAENASIQPKLDFSPPPEFQGEAGYWTPEYMLLAAVAACFVTTFLAIAGFSKFDVAGLEVETEGEIEKAEGGFLFTRIYIRPMLTLRQEKERDRGLRLLEKAERACLISRSLRSQVILEPEISVAAPQA